MKNSERLIKKQHYITSPFGDIRRYSVHNGTDYGVYRLKGIECYSPCDMEILKIGLDRYGGTFMYTLSRELNKVALFYHCEKFDFQAGDILKRGQFVGIISNKGKQPMGIHLHFSWIEYDYKSLYYYSANYLDFEKYTFPFTDYDRVQSKYDFNDETMTHLNKYLYNSEMFVIMLKDSNKQVYALKTIKHILEYQYGEVILNRL